MKVRAIEQGYYDLTRRKVGKVFEIESVEEFSENWMEWVDAPPAGWKPKGKRGSYEEQERKAKKSSAKPHGIHPLNKPNAGKSPEPTAYSELSNKSTVTGDQDVI